MLSCRYEEEHLTNVTKILVDIYEFTCRLNIGKKHKIYFTLEKILILRATGGYSHSPP